jgi:hypothetical protein
MGLTAIDEIFQGPWGIVEERRTEIETGHYGAFDRIYQEEIEKNFLPISSAAELLGCHESTARDWLREADSRYIIRGAAYLYLVTDVEATKAKRLAHQAAKRDDKKRSKSTGSTAAA